MKQLVGFNVLQKMEQSSLQTLQNASLARNNIPKTWKTSSTVETANQSSSTTDNSDNRGRRHSSSFSAIVGNIGSRIKRSSSTVGSSPDGRILGLQNMPEGSLSTPSKRKNTSTSEMSCESSWVKSRSRRSSTPVNQTPDGSISASKGKKTSLIGMFSTTRKSSLQSCPHVADQLPPKPPQLNKETTHTHQLLSLKSRNHSCDQTEKLGNADEGMNNIANGSTKMHNSCPKPILIKNHPISGSNTFSRTRIHKHSLQQGNKWKLLQQKVLGNLDEEKDDEQELPINQHYGKAQSNITRN